LFLEDGTIIDGLDNIVAWAAANPRGVVTHFSGH